MAAVSDEIETLIDTAKRESKAHLAELNFTVYSTPEEVKTISKSFVDDIDVPIKNLSALDLDDEGLVLKNDFTSSEDEDFLSQGLAALSVSNKTTPNKGFESPSEDEDFLSQGLAALSVSNKTAEESSSEAFDSPNKAERISSKADVTPNVNPSSLPTSPSLKDTKGKGAFMISDFSISNIIGLYRQETDADDVTLSLEDLYFFVGYKFMRFLACLHEIIKNNKNDPSPKFKPLTMLIKYRGDISIEKMYDVFIPALIDMNAFACRAIFKTLFEWTVTCPADVTVYRGLFITDKSTTYDKACLSLIMECKEGGSISFPTFTSTSLTKSVANRFSGGILLEILLPSNAPFTYISDEESGEDEILLNAGAKLRLISKDEDGHPKIYKFLYTGLTMDEAMFNAQINNNADLMKAIYKLRRSSRQAEKGAEEKGGKRGQTKRKVKQKKSKRKKESKRKANRYYGGRKSRRI